MRKMHPVIMEAPSEYGEEPSATSIVPLEAQDKVWGRRRTGSSTHDNWTDDGVEVHTRVVGGIDFIEMSTPVEIFFEFFTPVLKEHDWAGFVVPEGYLTRVYPDGTVIAVGHTDASMAGAVTTNELWVQFAYAHGPQVQAINQYQFWPYRRGPACCLTTWHKDVQYPSDQIGGVDSGYDLSPTASRRRDQLVGSVNGSAPDVDWYRRAAYNPKTGLYYLITAELMLYVFRESAFNSIPPNVTVFSSFDLASILPSNIAQPPGPFKDSPVVPPVDITYPDYRWSWRSDCGKVATIVRETVVSGVEATAVLELDITTTIDVDLNFTVSAAVNRVLHSGFTHGKYFIGAEYAFNTVLKTYDASGVGIEPLLLMYTKYFSDLPTTSDYTTRLYVEDHEAVLFTFEMTGYHNNTESLVWHAQLLSVDLRSLSFVFHTRKQNANTTSDWYAWDEAVFVYSFGKLQHSHGFFGHTPATSLAFFTADASWGDLFIPADSGEFQDLQSYADPHAQAMMYPTPRTSFQVHPKGHFSIAVGPIIASNHALPMEYDYVTPPASAANVEVEQHHVDLIGFRKSGTNYDLYSHRSKCNEAFGIEVAISAYDAVTTQFDYYYDYASPHVYYKVMSYNHYTNDPQFAYKRTNFQYKQSNVSVFSNVLATYKGAGDTTRTAWEISATGVYWFVWPFHLPYVRGESTFVGGTW